jgi:hypothetical protein
MSCPRNSSITNYDSHDINNKSQYSQNLTQNDTQYIESNCRKITNTYPSFTPSIFSTSTNTSQSGIYSLVYINGSNFLPAVYGTTYVNFGTYKNLPITFYSTSQISFVVPLNAVAGTYNIVVVNIYNSNFSPSTNFSYAGNLNYSSSIPYILT